MTIRDHDPNRRLACPGHTVLTECIEEHQRSAVGWLGRQRERVARVRHDPLSCKAQRSSRRHADSDGSITLRSLIVNDNSSFLGAARSQLVRVGIEVVGVASTGAEALRLANELRPDVALVDIDLGDESGFDVVRRLAGLASLAGARIVLISTHAEKVFAELIEQSPAVGFLPKSGLSASRVYKLLE
jgi:two-component system, NarL family, nitrate/nitrite response regulator NarL